jgi:TetR/AcrR family fatty acid metabolism transcriptional regulator
MDVKEERKAQILDAAMCVYARSGFEKARVDDIAEEAGLAKGTLYLYFNSKDDIMLSILDRMVGRELQDLGKLLSSERSAKDKLIKFVEYSVDEVEMMKPTLPVLFEFWGAMSHQDEVREKLASHYHSLVDMLVPIIQQGIDEHDFYRMDARSAAIALEAVMEGTILLWASNPEMVDLRSQLKNSLQLMLKGLEVR